MVTRKASDKFPLWLHPRGLWCKKIKGHFHYFGQDKDAALTEYVRVRDDLAAGRKPRPKDDSASTVAYVANAFLTAKRERVDSGELSSAMWSEYHRTCEMIVATFGGARSVADLRPEDFGRLRAKAAKRLGPFALAKLIQMTKTVFAFAYRSELIVVPIRYGDQFDKPARRVLRLERERSGTKLISAKDALKLIRAASPQLRAMILLGLNCAYGQSDCSNLQREALTARPGWLDAPRQKTGIARRCPLWPETIAALKAVEMERPAPKDPANEGCVFITYKGMRWVKFTDRGTEKRGSRNDSAGQEFTKLVRNCRVKLAGGMYVLRHTFRTVADEAKDRVAVDTIMGHADDSMGAVYREKISDERLVAITDHVRTWLDSGR